MFAFKITRVILGMLAVLSISTTSAQVVCSVIDRKIEVSNQIVKAKFTINEGQIIQQYFGRRDTSWILVAESFAPGVAISGIEPTQLFNTSLDKRHRFLVTEILTNATIIKNTAQRVTVKLEGRTNSAHVTQLVSLDGDDRFFAIEVAAELKEQPVKLDYILSTFTFNLDGPPQFIHTPGLKFDNEDSKQNLFKLLPAQDQVIGDRSFHAPAVILQHADVFSALVPDLNAINKYAIKSPDARRTTDISRNVFSVPIEEDKYTMPTALDLNVKTGFTKKPVFSYGVMDNIIAHHIRYQRRNDSSMIRTLNSPNVKYGFDLFVAANLSEKKGFQMVSAYQWKRYGHPTFKNRPHLAYPFEEYERIVDSITFNPIRSKLSGEFKTSGRNTNIRDIDVPLPGYKDMGSWLEFDLRGLPAGGYRSAIPWWNDVIHNSAFWNNARDASGFYFWGQALNKEILIDRARRIINFCISAPRNESGLFATLYNANTKEWGLQFSDPPHGKNEFFLRESRSYDVAAMSKTSAHLLDYYLRCERDERIVDYLRGYADWVLSAIDGRGAVPSYVTDSMVVSPLLLYSAQPAASMWFLAAYYNATKQEKYRSGAKRIASYLEKEILPEAKWIDMEQYYSCGKKPLAFERDVWQNQIARGNLANIWACEGFAALYEATGEKHFLDLGEECIDYVSFYQCVWEPHFIYTAYPFGGFAADNSDNAAMLDARQAEMVKPYIWYGKALGRQDLLERGVAAAKSSVVLMNLPEHKKNNIYRHTNIYPYGLGPENIDHEAHPQSAMRTHPSWGEGSGVFTGLAEAYRSLHGGYVDFEENIFVGVNGIVIEQASLKGKTIELIVKNQLSSLTAPWPHVFDAVVELRGLAQGRYILNLNGHPQRPLSQKQLSKLKFRVYPNGKIELQKM